MPHTPNFWAVYERLVADDALPARAQRVVEAAMLGPEHLTATLASVETLSKDPRQTPVPDETPVPKAYLRRIEASGFRGVGPRSVLDVKPGPGLTLVVGRNGSGKSSFVEGLEVALTGDSTRWKDKKPDKDWRSGWRNLHVEGATQVRASFTVEGQTEPLAVETRWGPGVDLADGDRTVRTGTRELDGGLSSIGWTQAVEKSRPFLSYNDVSRAWDRGPSKLFDTLMSMLGLEDVRAALSTLADRRKEIAKRKRDTSTLKKELLHTLSSSTDPRASACAEVISKRKPDLPTLSQALGETGDGREGGNLTALKRLVDGVNPSQAAVDEACHAVSEALEAQRSAALDQQTESLAVAELLDDAIAWHARSESSDCPVCGSAFVLDEEWRVASAKRSAALRQAATAASNAAGTTRAAHAQLRQVIAKAAAAPTAFTPSADLAIDARSRLAQLPEGPEALVAHVQRHYADFLAKYAACQAEAQEQLNTLQAEWLPAKRAIETWRDHYELVLAEQDDLKDVKGAEDWLKDTDQDLRDRAFRPIADAAKETWAHLRAGSNVDIEGIALAGNATQRHVNLGVTVDGTKGAALGVMSQGELHALALSIFLPRLLRLDSPFGFVIIDDPVQAMDPAKVDGLARVLEHAAKTHQVIVFTHDPRLPAAARRLGIDATVLNVRRSRSSAVSVQPGLDPVQQHIEDARHLCYNRKELGDHVVRLVVPGLCRAALEAALTERTWRGLLKKGESHRQIEQKIRSAKGLRDIASLAFYGNTSEGNKAQGRIAGLVPGGNDILAALKAHAHTPLPKHVDLDRFVQQSERLARAVNP